MSEIFSKFDDRRVTEVWDGIHGHVVNGERMTMALVDLDANAALPEHAHENEQMGFVIKGELTMTIGGETRRLLPGDTYSIPSLLPHSAVTGPDGCVVCDVFAPIRLDWAGLPESEPSPSSWQPKS